MMQKKAKMGAGARGRDGSSMVMSVLSLYTRKPVISHLSRTSQQNNLSSWMIMSGYCEWLRMHTWLQALIPATIRLLQLHTCLIINSIASTIKSISASASNICCAITTTDTKAYNHKPWDKCAEAVDVTYYVKTHGNYVSSRHDRCEPYVKGKGHAEIWPGHIPTEGVKRPQIPCGHDYITYWRG